MASSQSFTIGEHGLPYRNLVLRNYENDEFLENLRKYHIVFIWHSYEEQLLQHWVVKELKIPIVIIQADSIAEFIPFSKKEILLRCTIVFFNGGHFDI